MIVTAEAMERAPAGLAAATPRSDGIAGGARLARWLALLIPAALLTGAWGSQLFGGLVPCEMCQWQRWPHYAALMIAILAFLPIWPTVTRFEFVAILLAVVADFLGGGMVGAHIAYTLGQDSGSAPWLAFIGGALIATLVTFGCVLAPNKVAIALAALAIALSGAIGIFHAGVEYHWWEGITACTSSVGSGGGSTADVLSRILRAPIVRCDAPQWSWSGISLAGFNAIFSIGGALLIWVLLLGSRRRI